MGGYAPVVDYPLEQSLTQTAGPPPASSGCAVFPDGKGAVAPSCGVLTDSPISISAVTTQCQAPGCDQVFVQTQLPPPMSINGVGFGNFPNGLPFAGTSNYLEITDVTQNWSAGYSGDACTVSITSWADYLIQLVANVNQNGVCPLAVNDQLSVTVWNPESLTSATISATVQPN
jgi:hypothetical protein